MKILKMEILKVESNILNIKRTFKTEIEKMTLCYTVTGRGAVDSAALYTTMYLDHGFNVPYLTILYHLSSVHFFIAIRPTLLP